MVVGGIACSSTTAAESGAGSTHINPYNTIDTNGTINGWCTKAGTANLPAKIKLKVFRINGSSYDYIGESGLLTFSAAGVKTGSCNIAVLAGDIVGIYVESGTFSYASSTERSKYLTGDVTTNTEQSSWGSVLVDYKIIIRAANDYSTFDEIFIDLNKPADTLSGGSFAEAKKTMKAGWDILNSTGTMHVASGDYSAQTTIAYNKSWKLSPEDPNSLGYKIVKIPKST